MIRSGARLTSRIGLKVLEQDPREIHRAAGDAQRMSNYLIDRAHTHEREAPVKERMAELTQKYSHARGPQISHTLQARNRSKNNPLQQQTTRHRAADGQPCKELMCLTRVTSVQIPGSRARSIPAKIRTARRCGKGTGGNIPRAGTARALSGAQRGRLLRWECIAAFRSVIWLMRILTATPTRPTVRWIVW